MTNTKLIWQRDNGDPESENLDIEVQVDHLDPLFKEMVGQASKYDNLVAVARRHKKRFAYSLDDVELRARILQDEELYVDISTAYDGSTVTFRNI